MQLKKATYTVFDFETTGLYPYSGDKICEIGAIRADLSKNSRKTFHSLVNPARPVSYGAFAVNGITADMLAGKPAIDEVLPQFMKFIRGSVLVAYNAGFDLGFLENALGEKKDVLKDFQVIDALSLARDLFPGIGRYNLANVARSLGIDTHGEHRAMADAFMTLGIFEKELELTIAKGSKTIEDIAHFRKGTAHVVRKVKDYKIELIEKAIRQEKKLNIVYRSAWNNKVTERVITPKVIHKGYDKCYIVAHCHLKGAERNFRLDGIVEAKPEEV